MWGKLSCNKKMFYFFNFCARMRSCPDKKQWDKFYFFHSCFWGNKGKKYEVPWTSVILAIVGKLPASGLWECMRFAPVVSTHSWKQLQCTVQDWVWLLSLPPQASSLHYYCHVITVVLAPAFQSWLWEIIPYWMLWMSEIKSASLFLPQYFGYKHSTVISRP